MGMLRICATDDCQVKTLGTYCIHHEVVPVAAMRLRPALLVAAPVVVRAEERVPVAAA